jgi:hypothetical protein
MKRFSSFMALLVAALSASAQLPQGLVLRFSCDEFRNSGTQLPDVTGSNNNGRVIGVKWAAGGRLGAACDFSGWNSSVQVPDSPMLSSKQVTVCVWFKTGKSEGADRTLFDKQAANGYALSLLGSNAGARKGRLNFVVCGHECLGDTNLTDSVWHHAAAAFNGESLKLYVDGLLQKQVTEWRGEIPANGQDLTIGMNRSSPGPKEKQVAFEGLLDEILVFNRALSADEIKSALAATQSKFTKQQVERRLAELKELLDRGLILQDFYDRKVKECEVK